MPFFADLLSFLAALSTLATSKQAFPKFKKQERFVPIFIRSTILLGRTWSCKKPLNQANIYISIYIIFSSLPRLIPKISDEMIRLLFGEGVRWGVDIRGCAWACMWAQPLNLPHRHTEPFLLSRLRNAAEVSPPRLLRVSVAGAFPKHRKIRNNALRCPMA